MLEHRLEQLKQIVKISLFRSQRSRRRAETSPAASSSPVARLLIIPSDPWSLVGSKGDEAMMQAVAQQLRHRQPSLVVGVLTATPEASLAAEQLGFVPVHAWSRWLARANRHIAAFDPDAVVVVGADVMDGYYNPVFTTRILLMADAAARRGTRVTVLGFSFNDSPNRHLRPVFDGLSPSISINVRDETSLRRFQAFSTAPARLVADAAFMLEPDASTESVKSAQDWAAQRRAAGDVVLGFNLHPMLIKGATKQHVHQLVTIAVSALEGLAEKRSVSLLLIPHDYRGATGDSMCLTPIHQALEQKLGERLMLLFGRHTAAELKAVAGATDGVVTGRMHLAIATLGMGRPVAALTYQDKFQGLLVHFQLPQRFLLAHRALLEPGRLESMMLDFLDNLPTLERQVADRLATVQEAARLNLWRLV